MDIDDHNPENSVTQSFAFIILSLNEKPLKIQGKTLTKASGLADSFPRSPPKPLREVVSGLPKLPDSSDCGRNLAEGGGAVKDVC